MFMKLVCVEGLRGPVLKSVNNKCEEYHAENQNNGKQSL